jgi:hypothetical protein
MKRDNSVTELLGTDGLCPWNRALRLYRSLHNSNWTRGFCSVGDPGHPLPSDGEFKNAWTSPLLRHTFVRYDGCSRGQFYFYLLYAEVYWR